MTTSQLPTAPSWSGRAHAPQPRIGRPLLVAAVVSSVALAAMAVVAAPLELGPAQGGSSPSAPAAGPVLVSQTFGPHHKNP
jgi:hypothetical protein